MSFSIGQRWVSQTEPKLGLGIIAEMANRRVTISFPASGETRTYAVDNAPISRVTYKPGDRISNHEEQQFVVEDTTTQNNLVIYQVRDDAGELGILSEVELNCFIQFTSPLQRLMSGHYDRNRAFRLRYQTLQHLDRLQQSPVRGLIGSRTSLQAHQLYIADKVAQRHAPRVLLADEVGLGKTIEAGMILHAQLHKGLAQRALIVVPPTLVHQWLVEMLRRFNLSFAIFDEERFESLREEGQPNPFESEQLILCDLDFLTLNEDARMAAVAAGWDLLIVDEAHHLHWSPEASGPEYQCVEQLAQVSAGVLLLTATPEQAGIASHFARLRLLDPDRFHDLTAFIEQEQRYGEISALVKQLQAHAEDEQVPAALKEQLQAIIGADQVDMNGAPSAWMNEALQALLDQHGTGRVLFRNTRQSVSGFPQRILEAHPLALDEASDADAARRDWLVAQLKQLRPEKVLVICSSAEKALALESHLRLKEGLRSAAFHEGLSIVERDRAAAYFADREDGAQTLICSEIGSEGRNFQFAHHLVLFDLPENPDLLEQRIGRLDRIGQAHDIHIHVPYLPNSRQEALYRWYHEGLDAFTHSCAAGYALYETFADELNRYLDAGEIPDAFLHTVRQRRDLAMAELQKGRDPLLELNSCNPERAAELIEQVEWEESSQSLSSYMDLVFSLYGVEQEQQSDGTVVIHPGEHMLNHQFPGLSDEGATLTTHRLKALVREDVEFLSWEHPMVNEVMEQTLASELGNAAISTMSVKGVPAGTLFLEAIFVLNSMAPRTLQLDRFLPLSPQRYVVNATGRDLGEVLPHDKLNELCTGLRRKVAPAIVKEIRDEMPKLLEHAQKMAENALPEMLAEARQRFDTFFDREIQRMVALAERNPLIREDEINALRAQQQAGSSYLEKTGLELQAMRIIINT
ncbi:MAG: RNA polymerase-associated protein RapA [Oleiphilaceae bacterium]|nr:RNA polymerase-associated protein RapA [Oleiphilaceae bacterium]